MSPYLTRAQILMDQNRYEMAIAELGKAMAADPEDADLHALTALCHSELDQHREAIESARTSIRLDPEYGFAHYALANAFFQNDEVDNALAAIHEALRLNPEASSYHGLAGNLHLAKRSWRDALAAADRGLTLDAEDVHCMHVRGLALKQLNRSEEASEILEEALRKDPDNAHNHAHQGWQMIEQAHYDQAQYHFREALRIDPNLEWARSGMAEVLKAKNFIYRILLRYSLWLSKFEGKMAFAVIVGFYILFRILRSISKSNPQLEPYITPIIAVYIGFVILTWLGTPIFNLFLRLHPIGRYVLDADEVKASNWVGLLFCIGLVGLAVWLITDWIAFIMLAASSAALMIPVSSSVGHGKEKGGKALRIYALILGGLALAAFALALVDLVLALIPGGLFLIGFFAYTWVANIMILRT